jgi:glucoamylase
LTEPLDAWIARQVRRCAAGMMLSVSPVGIVKTRPGFGQTVRPVRGAIVASPVLAAYDPDPDYFFHWYRDSALVIDALRTLFEDGAAGAEVLAHLADFAEFSASLAGLDGAALAAARGWRGRVAPDFERYLRSDQELQAVRGQEVGAESRVNADATLDFSRWSRPQHDGPPLRALALLRWMHALAAAGAAGAKPGLDAAMAALVRADLEFTRARAQQPSYDIWEEEPGIHYYTLRVSAAALELGGHWLQAQGEAAAGLALRGRAREILRQLDGFWLEDEGYLRSRLPAGGAGGARSAKELDIAVILAAVHADGAAAHGVADPRMHATLARLEGLFEREYPINRQRPPDRAPAMGRYPDDAYYSGGAYYFSTLGAAEFCFRAAGSCPDAARWVERGDAFLRTVRDHTPPDGALSEQFDGRTGAQTSARHLAWSYAAFITCAAARGAARACA